VTRVGTTSPTVRYPRKRGTWYVVRDAQGHARHTGRTKAEALAPYVGAVTKTERRGLPRADVGAPALRKARLWLFLYRHGWRCRCEPRHAPPPPRLTTAGSDASPTLSPSRG
jgi:hypothetical protein